MTLQVVDAPERQRYEAIRDGAVLGFAAYQKANELIVFTHTEVDPLLEGQGVGGALVRVALDNVRNLGLRVLPICPFGPGMDSPPPRLHRPGLRRPTSKVTD